MNFKFLVFAVSLCMFNYTFGQEATTIETSSTAVSEMTSKKCSSTCTKKKTQSTTTAYSDREWKKIQKEMKKNRKKRAAYSSNEHAIPKRILDTIVLEAPVYHTNKTQLSSW